MQYLRDFHKNLHVVQERVHFHYSSKHNYYYNWPGSDLFYL